MLNREKKAIRLLSMYKRLCEGKAIDKEAESVKYGATLRTIQRDLDDIRAFLAEERLLGMDNRTIIYDKEKRVYLMARV